MTEPGEDLCLECHHPDHGKAECVALCGVFYTDDGEQDDICDCTGSRVYDLGGVIVSGGIWISNDSGEDEEVTPWPF